MVEATRSQYKNLEVWKEAMDLVVGVYEVACQLPPEEKYGLADQMRRAAVSIPSNIAEGQRRATTKETLHFCSIALGSAAELETQLELAHRLYRIEVSKCEARCLSVVKMLYGLSNGLKRSL